MQFSRRRFLKTLAAAGALTVTGVPFRPAPGHANPTETENGRPGAADWEVINAATNREIEGYASLTSVDRGGQISLFVRTTDPTYTIDIFRMAWYGGLGARRMLPTIIRAGAPQVMPTPDPVTGMTECDWIDPFVLTLTNPLDPTDWPSGVYLAKLTAAVSGKESYVVFVVRDDARASDFLFLCSVNTYQAYNNWGGKSIYDSNSTGGRASKISFNRPYAINPYGTRLDGAGDFLRRWEYNMVRFLEREGYDVAYATDVDAHESGQRLLQHRGALVVGHNEYWSWEMRANVTAARDAGVSLGFFGANTCYWQIRYEASPLTGQANRTLVCYKAATTDPYALDADPSNDHLVTVRWRASPVNLPEDAFIGVMYVYDPVDADIVIENAASWVCNGTGLRTGDHLPGLLGYEVDREFGHQPAGTQRIAHSPVPRTTETSDMTVYTAPSGATVFATGSMHFNWGLDDYNSPALHSNRVSVPAQQMTRNVLSSMLGNRPPGATPVTSQRIATDGFESGTFAGGTGWSGAWTKSGDVSIRTNVDGPQEGRSHVRLRRKTGYLRRTVSLAGAQNVRLTFWAKVNSFESSDTALVKVSPDRVTFTTVRVFTSADSTNTYRYYDLDLAGFAMTATFSIAFDAEMSSTGDYWFLDNIQIVGVRPQP